MKFTQKIMAASKTLNFSINGFRKESRIEDIAIVGHPGILGGARAELDHQIICWQAMGLKVHICEVETLYKHQKDMAMEARGCIYHTPGDWKSLNGMHVISFCNMGFLENLKEIKKHARTATFVNCMTWSHGVELKAHEEGLIDFFLYQSDHQLESVADKLRNTNSIYRPIRFKPYFFPKNFTYKDNRKNDCFQFGRISRDDPIKFNDKQFWIYDQIESPLPKKGLVLGWGDLVKSKSSETIPSYVEAIGVGGVSLRDFYDFVDVIIMAANTYENLPRVGFEAMSSGSVLIVDNRGGWKIQVEDGVTGYLCDTCEDFIRRASELAHEEQKKEDMRAAAKEKLEKEWGIEASMESWDRVFRQIEKGT